VERKSERHTWTNKTNAKRKNKRAREMSVNEKTKTYDTTEDVTPIRIFVPHAEVDEYCCFVLLDRITGSICKKMIRPRRAPRRSEEGRSTDAVLTSAIF